MPKQKQPVTRRQLLDIIAQAADEGWTKLELRDKRIAELPDENCSPNDKR